MLARATAATATTSNATHSEAESGPNPNVRSPDSCRPAGADAATRWELEPRLYSNAPVGVNFLVAAYGYTDGGDTTIDGEPGADRQENTRLGATLAFPVSRYLSVKRYGSSGTWARLGADFDTVCIAWQTRWGGGL